MKYAIILAGGIGRRFWPLSQIDKPKQFLNFFYSSSLLEQTVLRLNHLVEKENIYLATSILYRKIINDYIKKIKLKRENILFEPERKNTFLPIAYLTYKIFQNEPQAVVGVFPSDHFIKERKKFLKVVKTASILAEKGFIVTLGIRPYRAETGYGYIKISDKPLVRNKNIFKVEKFIEKPPFLKAKKFLKDKRYFWNAGIFIFKVEVMVEEIKKYQPETFSLIKENFSNLNKIWEKGISDSIDYAIMEKSKNLALVEFSGRWLDLGSFQAIEELLRKDKNKNIFKCKFGYVGYKNQNIFVYSENRFIACLGLKDLYIIETKDGLLVSSKDKINKIKELIKSKN
jgi:mannose-1-phosphate guanylyltransferase/mannose-6-phosphate isomerase